MEDRINIDGTWYIREDSAPQAIKPLDIPLDLTWTESCVFEDDNYCFEMSRLRKGEDKDFYNGLDIKFTDKRGGTNREDWKSDYWDNTNWMRGVIDDDPESIATLNETVCPEGARIVKTLLLKMKEKGWLYDPLENKND